MFDCLDLVKMVEKQAETGLPPEPFLTTNIDWVSTGCDVFRGEPSGHNFKLRFLLDLASV